MIVLKDKKDIKHCPASFLKDHEWESHGQYDSLQFVNPNVKVEKKWIPLKETLGYLDQRYRTRWCNWRDRTAGTGREQ